MWSKRDARLFVHHPLDFRSRDLPGRSLVIALVVARLLAFALSFLVTLDFRMRSCSAWLSEDGNGTTVMSSSSFLAMKFSDNCTRNAYAATIDAPHLRRARPSEAESSSLGHFSKTLKASFYPPQDLPPCPS
jgi:hypothetical protein